MHNGINLIFVLSKLNKTVVSRLIEDSDLINQVRQGDMNAFKILVERYEKAISNVVIGLLGNTPEAEEVGQEVFIKFFYKVESYRFDASLKTYLTRIAINLSLNELKKRNISRKRFFYKEEINFQAIAADDSNYEIKEIVEKALQLINPSLRAVIVLRMIEGYSTKETAKILKIPVGTVLSRLSRAQEKLRPILKEYSR